VALGYENHHYKYISTGCFLKATVTRNYVFLLVVNLRKQTVKMNLHYGLSSEPIVLFLLVPIHYEPSLKNMTTTKRNRRCTSATSVATPLEISRSGAAPALPAEEEAHDEARVAGEHVDAGKEKGILVI
jgi:hypothetical protein